MFAAVFWVNNIPTLFTFLSRWIRLFKCIKNAIHKIIGMQPFYNDVFNFWSKIHNIYAFSIRLKAT